MTAGWPQKAFCLDQRRLVEKPPTIAQTEVQPSRNSAFAIAVPRQWDLILKGPGSTSAGQPKCSVRSRTKSILTKIDEATGPTEGPEARLLDEVA